MRFNRIGNAVKWRLSTVSDWFSSRARRMRAIGKILSNPAARDTRRADADRERLQSRPSLAVNYGYDPKSVWQRAMDRACKLLEMGDLATPSRRVVELGCGDGMLGVLLETYGHRCVLVDAEDWRDDRARALEFRQADCCDRLPFEDGEFDFACSFNAFEHLADPEATLDEMLRVIRPGGGIYISFDPLYCSPRGLHAYHTLHMPYPQFLFSPECLERLLVEHGIVDLGRTRTQLQSLNQWRLTQYRALWRREGCQIVSEVRVCDWSGLPIVLDYPECFRGMGLTLDDLTVSGLSVLLRKPET